MAMRPFDSRQSGGVTVDGQTHQGGSLLTHAARRIVSQHSYCVGEEPVLARTTGSLLAPVAGQRVYGPGPDAGIGVGHVFDQLRHGVLVQEVVKYLATAHPDHGVGMSKAGPHRSSGPGAGPHKLPQRSPAAVRDAQVFYRPREVGLRRP
ncbi:MAG TPA: hypothetical protein VMF65_06995 [Acidimicrobiales bacterium]|nr:hypothetical protein [Acidimicrobiales bacterium]